MRNIEPGMTARSLAGHDKGGLFVVLRVQEEYLWLSDGKCRPVEKPKKKKIKHLQISYRKDEEINRALLAGSPVRNEEIRRFLRSAETEESTGIPIREED